MIHNFLSPFVFALKLSMYNLVCTSKVHSDYIRENYLLSNC